MADTFMLKLLKGRTIHYSLSVIFALTLTTTHDAWADAGDRYDCSVYNFTTYPKSSDTNFAANNWKATFEIIEGSDAITVVKKSAQFDNSADEYLVVGRTIAGIFGLHPSTIANYSIVFSNHPVGPHDGDAEATIVISGSSMASVWFLTCARGE